MKTNQSMSILFWLAKSRTENTKSTIYCRITIQGKRTEISTAKKTDPEKWNGKACMVDGNSEEAKSTNKELTRIKSDLQRIYDRLEAVHSIVTAEMVRQAFAGNTDERKTVLDAFTEHNKILEERAGAEEPTLTFKTVQRFDIIKNKIKAFLKNKYKVSDKLLSDVRPTFSDDFKHFLTTNQNIGMNTAMKYVKSTKQVFKFAVERDWLQKNPLASFKCSYRNPSRERLTWLELLELYNKDISNPRLSEVRDVYVFSCFTGYAYTDVYHLTADNVVLWIDGQKWLVKNREKTDNKSNVPLMEIPLAILEKYKTHPYCQEYKKLLPVNSNQRYNSYLKEIASICNINKNLTTHTARHTFATTVLMDNDCPIESVSEMLGHSSIRTTEIYTKVTDVKVSKNMKVIKEKLNAQLQLQKTGTC